MTRQMPWKRILVGAIILAEVAALSYVAWSAKSGPTAGVVVPATEASIALSGQRDVVHVVTIDRVVAPADSWVVVQADSGNGIPGAVLGSQWVAKGESRDLQIELDPLSPLPQYIFATLLLDKGQPHMLEYYVAPEPGMESVRGMGSTVASGSAGDASMMDTPVIAGGQVVRERASVTALSFAVGVNQASISEATHTAEATSVLIPHVLAPAQSWLSVSVESTSGGIGDVLGVKLVPSGESSGVVVPLSATAGRKPIIATLHVDLGTAGHFDFSPADGQNSYDQPYVAGGQTVSVPVNLVR